MPHRCFLDLLPIELLYSLFIYFLAHEILLSFSNVSDHVNAVLFSYSAYQVNLKSIRKIDFDRICRYIQTRQIISLTLSDDDDTPGLSKLFFSRFRIEQFTQLQSLRLIKIEFESLESIFPNLHELNRLRSLSFDVELIRQKYPTLTADSSNNSNQINFILFNVYTNVLPRLTRLHLNDGNVFKSTPFPYLCHLKLKKCSLDQLKVIFSNAPQLQSLDISLELDQSNLDISVVSSNLTRLNLEILSEYYNI